jgi:hypothetical protein
MVKSNCNYSCIKKELSAEIYVLKTEEFQASWFHYLERIEGKEIFIKFDQYII